MYTGSGISKETQHISPHIAAHKSSLAPTSSVSSITSATLNSGGPYDLVHHHINKSGFNTHIPTYKVGMHQPHQSIAKGLDHNGASSLGRHGHTAMSPHHSKSTPQDLSAHATGTDKAMPLELTPHSSIHHKPLPHIHTVVSQGVSGNQIGSLMPAHQTDRGSPYFRVPDSVINVQGPSAVLVSSGGEGVSSSSHSISHAASMVHAVSSHSSATNLTTMPAASLATTVSLPGGVASTLSNSHMMPNECSAASNVSTGCVMPHSDLRGVKKEKAEQLEGMGLAAGQREVCHPEGGPQRDLVRQALQAVVTNPQHKTGNDQEVIEYNYTAGDIAELLMMNIQVNASLQAMNKGNGPPEHESGEVVMLQPAEVDETNSLTSVSQNPKRRRPKLSDEAHAERRVRIALRMREKRAAESDEQKRLRRIREAERMRRKRAAEDEEQKGRRRLEAAARARNRRTTMSMQERILDRQRAAERMRLRRATESSDAKTVRRLKAAERMRKRRATETPEQRNQRRQNIAVRMKARRKRKSEESINGDEPEVLNQSVNTRLVKTENTRSATQQESSGPVANVNPDHSTPQTVTSSPHIYVPSTIGAGGGSIAVLHMDSSLPSMSLGHSANPGLSTVDMTQLGQPLSLQKSSSANQEQKQAVVTPDTPASMSSQETSSLSSLITSPHGTLEPLSLHKASSYHHHIPHLLHYHQPHSSSLQQHPHQHHHHHHHHNHHHSSHHHLQQRHQHQ